MLELELQCTLHTTLWIILVSFTSFKFKKTQGENFGTCTKGVRFTMSIVFFLLLAVNVRIRMEGI